MSASRDAELARSDELCVLFELGHWVGAMRSVAVARVLAGTEVQLVRSGDAVPGEDRGMPALTLAALLEVDAPTRAWLVLQLPGIGSVALGVGDCIGAQPVDTFRRLPAGTLSARVAGVVATFVLARSARRFGVGSVGLLVEPTGLCTANEWKNARHRLKGQEQVSRREAG